MTSYLLAAALMIVPILLSAQNPPASVETLESPDPGLLLQRYRQTDAARFANASKLMDEKQLEAFSFILTNASGKNILGLTVRWMMTDASGKSSVINQWTDSFFLVQRPVLAANARLLVGPGVFLPEAPETKAGLTMAGTAATLEQFQQSTNLRVSLDTVIFDDGKVVGPDRSQTVADIEARKAAANVLVDAVSNAITTGADPVQVLSKLAVSEPSARVDKVGEWRVRLAHNLLRAPNLQRQIEVLKSLPEPKLFR